MKTNAPSETDLAAELGSAQNLWRGLIDSVAARAGSIRQEWKPSKSSFGWMCLLKQKKRTLLYLTPGKETVLVAIVLGERAVALALASAIPEGIKTLIREARPYAEGRGIRFPVSSAAEVSMVNDLVAIKMTPK